LTTEIGETLKRDRTKTIHPNQNPGAQTDTFPGVVRGASAAISVRDLYVRYGEVHAVRGINIEVRTGEVFGLLGPNGAGKTTTLACIQGLVPPTSGTVEVLGLDVQAHASRIKRQLGVSLQSTALFPRLKVIELLELFAAMYGQFPSREERLRLLRRFGLADKAGADGETLSGGQRQRLAIAIAIVNDPKIVVLDEPTTGLDPHARRSVWALIEGLRDEGRTVLLTTHYMDEAAALCGRVAIVDQGQIVALDTPAALVRYHAVRNLEDAFISLTESAEPK
jgi:ABC-2 type transport system ATP-binding protein